MNGIYITFEFIKNSFYYCMEMNLQYLKLVCLSVALAGFVACDSTQDTDDEMQDDLARGWSLLMVERITASSSVESNSKRLR